MVFGNWDETIRKLKTDKVAQVYVSLAKDMLRMPVDKFDEHEGSPFLFSAFLRKIQTAFFAEFIVGKFNVFGIGAHFVFLRAPGNRSTHNLHLNFKRLTVVYFISIQVKFAQLKLDFHVERLLSQAWECS